MARSDNEQPSAEIVALARNPHIRLAGSITDQTLASLNEQLWKVEDGSGPIAVELTTTGGDAEIGRRLALEVRLARERIGRRLVFIGKTIVYSAGATMMSGFPREDRFLTPDTMLLIHCRILQKSLELNGPLKSARIQVQQVVSEIDAGLKLEQEGFAALIEGSDVSMDEIMCCAEMGWYVPAAEALDRRLVAGIV